MSDDLPPTIDRPAAARWAGLPRPGSAPWLHEEVGRRMQQRLEWIRKQPRAWADWQPSLGGTQAHAAVAQRYPKAQAWVVEELPGHVHAVRSALQPAPWQMARWFGPQVRFAPPGPGAVDMVWANMALHMAADPRALVAQWHRMLGQDGFLMFSCLGPDTLRQLRAVYLDLGWPPAAHVFTDMHDWGDMLVHAGFAEPVMDMERIDLSFASPERLLVELRGLGRNLHPARFPGLRGRDWHARLREALAERMPRPSPADPLVLTFEIIYGHAVRPAPRVPVQSETTLTLDGMREVLRSGRGPAGDKH